MQIKITSKMQVRSIVKPFDIFRYYTVLFGVSRSIGIGSQVSPSLYLLKTIIRLVHHVNPINIWCLCSLYGTEPSDYHSRGPRV